MKRWLCVVCAMCMLQGCSRVATIYMEKGEPVEAEILSSDIDKVYVKEVSGVERTIARDEIAYVEHPSGTMVGGAVATGVGIVLSVVGFSVASGCLFDSDGRTASDACDPGLVALWVGIPTVIVGIPVTMAGSWSYFKSSDNLTADSTATSARPREVPAAWRVAPLVTRDERGEAVVGAGVSLTW